MFSTIQNTNNANMFPTQNKTKTWQIWFPTKPLNCLLELHSSLLKHSWYCLPYVIQIYSTWKRKNATFKYMLLVPTDATFFFHFSHRFFSTNLNIFVSKQKVWFSSWLCWSGQKQFNISTCRLAKKDTSVLSHQ